MGIGVGLAIFWYAYRLWLWKLLPPPNLTLEILRLIWEILLFFGMCIGLTVLFREKLALQGRISKAMASSQYTAHIFHVLFVVIFQYLVFSLVWPPLTKFRLVMLLAAPTTFLFSNWVRKPLRF